MATIIAFPARQIPRSARALDCSALSQQYTQPVKMFCEAVIFGCFLTGLVMMIYALGPEL